MKLLCFPYAGGTAAFYNEIKDLLGEKKIEVVALDYPGHGLRHKEPFSDDFYKLSLDMLYQIKEQLEVDEKYALMGYSMGSIVATEVVCRILESQDMIEPSHIFLAAHEAKTVKLPELADATFDEALKERILCFGAVPDELIGNKIFWRMYMPLYKADYTMISKYDFDKLILKTDIPATIFYSEDDTSYEGMNVWKKYYIGDVELYKFTGNHFFIEQYNKEITDIIYKRLLDCGGKLNYEF